jgi:RNA polymerase sigma-70 factor (ECF subfamily)
MGRPDNETTTADGELVHQARNGRPSAYAELVRRWSARVMAICHARVGRRDAAEDLVQETLLRGLDRLHSLKTPEKFGAWLSGIAQRVCLDWLKAKQTSQVPFTQLSANTNPEAILPSEGASADVEAERADELSWVMNEVESLSDDCREVLLLYYYHDVTYRELAELLGVSTATVNARLTRARAVLRERLNKLRK